MPRRGRRGVDRERGPVSLARDARRLRGGRARSTARFRMLVELAAAAARETLVGESSRRRAPCGVDLSALRRHDAEPGRQRDSTRSVDRSPRTAEADVRLESTSAVWVRRWSSTRPVVARLWRSRPTRPRETRTSRARRAAGLRPRRGGRARRRARRRAAPIASSVQRGRSTSPSGAPATTSRAASIPCVSGTRAADRLHPAGQLVDGDVDAADEQHQEVDEVGDEEDVAGAQADRADQHPERRARGDRVTTTTNASAGSAAGARARSRAAPARRAKPNAETTRPLTMNGSARPEEERRAGSPAWRAAARASRTGARSRSSSSSRRSRPSPLTCTALPTTKNVVVLEARCSGRGRRRRGSGRAGCRASSSRRCTGLDPVEERAVRDQPADEEDAQAAVTSARASRAARASRSKLRTANAPSTR